MGHSGTRAALIYLHATRERDQQIAADMGKLFRTLGGPRGAVPRPASVQGYQGLGTSVLVYPTRRADKYALVTCVR
jgi:hypothetical protein